MTDRLPVVRKEGQNVQIPAGDGLLLRGALNEARIVNVSAAATINFDTLASNTVAVAGSGTINTLTGGQLGCTRRMRFTQDGIVLGNLTGNIILPGTANIVVKVNDVAEFVSLTNGQWLCFNYSRADGTALVSSGSGSSPASTDALPEGTTNLYFTGARTLASTLTGFTSSVGTVTAADTVLSALQKLQGTKVDAVSGKGLSTNDYTTAEQSKLAGIASGATANSTDAVLLARANHTGTQAISTVDNLQSSLDGKVDKVAGQGLSDTNYTQAEKDKLAGLDPNHYRGTFTSYDALSSGVTSPVAGDYADVDPGAGTDAIRYIYDVNDTKWVSGGAATSLTAAQVKSLYESNPDTNAYTNAEKTKLAGVAANATANTDTDSLTEGSSNLYFTGARVLAALLTGLSVATGGAIVSSDSVLVAFGKLQKQITDLTTSVNSKEPAITAGTTSQYWNGAKAFVDFATSVRAAVLTGLSTTTSTPVTATDSVLSAIGKLQAQVSAGGSGSAAPLYMHVQDQKASGTGTTDPVLGSYLPRDLTTVIANEITGASLSSNTVSLPAGKYYVEGSAPFRSTNGAKLKVYNDTDSTTLLLGTSIYGNQPGISMLATVSGQFTITSDKNITLRYRVAAANTSGNGLVTSLGDIEIYAELRIWKLS